MTFSRFFGFGVLLWLLLAAAKAVFSNVLDPDSGVLTVLYGFVVIIVSLACARRLGFINYLEAILVTGVWTVSIVVADVLILQALLGPELIRRWQTWASYALTAVGIFFFHKKRHIQIRQELHALHGGGHSGGGHHKSHGDHSQQPHGHAQPGKH